MTPPDELPPSAQSTTPTVSPPPDVPGFESWLNGSNLHPSPAGPPPVPPGYELEKELGRGAMGVVYKAHDRRLNRPVALKVVLAGRHAHPKELARFLYEAETIAAIDDPHVVRVYDSGVHDGQPYFVMEFVPDGCLHDLLHPDPERPEFSQPLDPRLAAGLMLKLAGGVQAAHDRGLVHRDIKPRNVLLSAQRGTGSSLTPILPGAGDRPRPEQMPNPCPLTPKLADFGLARRLESLAASHGLAGTPHYMAPEQARGDALRVGPGSDVWALGVVLFECLTGQVPFAGTQPYQVIKKVAEEPPPAARSVNPRVPRDLELVVLKCLEKDPHRRYPTPLALADDLGRFLMGEPVRVRATGPAERCWRWARKRPTIAALSALLVLLLFAIGVAITLQTRREERQRFEFERITREKEDTDRRRTDAERQAAEGELRDEWMRYVSLVRRAERKLADGRPADARKLLAQCPAEWRGWEFAHLDRMLAGRPVLARHPGPASVFALADGRLATAGGGGVQVWTRGEPDGPPLTVGVHSAAAVSADGRRAAVGTAAGGVSVWDIPGGVKLFDAPPHEKAVAGLAFDPTGEKLVSVGADGAVVLSSGGKELARGKHPGGGTCVAWRPDGKGFATGGADGVVRGWTADASPKPVATSQAPTPPVAGLAFGRADDQEVLAAVGPGRLVQFDWDARPSGRPVELADPPKAVAVAADGSVLVGTAGGMLVRFAPIDGRRELAEPAAAGAVVGLAVGDDRVAAAGADGTVRAWPAGRSLRGRGARQVRFAGFTPAGAVAALVDDGLGGRRGVLSDPASLTDLPLPADPLADAVAVGPDWGVVGVRADGRLTRRAMDALTGQTLAVDRGGRLAAGLDAAGKLGAWDVTGRAARRLWQAEPGGKVLRVRVDGGLVLVALADGGVAGFEAADGRRRFLLMGDRPADAVAASADGRVVAVAAGEGVRVWAVGDGEPVRRFELLPDAARAVAVAVSPDGTRLATGGADLTVRVWDAAGGEELLELSGHPAAVRSVEFDPAGGRLLSLDDAGVAQVWDAAPPAAATAAAAAERLRRVPAAARGADAERLRRASGS